MAGSQAHRVKALPDAIAKDLGVLSKVKIVLTRKR